MTVNTIPEGHTVLSRNHLNEITECGIDQPAATIIHENDTHLVVKIPRHSYFTGLYMPRGYASPETVVYEKVEETDEGRRILAKLITAWDNTRPSKK